MFQLPFHLALFCQRQRLNPRLGRFLSKKMRLPFLSGCIAASLLISACQPPDDLHGATLNHSEKKSKTSTKSPIVISDDRVMMSADYILPIKPSRYQPSLGLEGVIEPIKKTQFRLLQAVLVNEVLIKEGQQVEKGMPLAIVTPALIAADDEDRDITEGQDQLASAATLETKKAAQQDRQDKNQSSPTDKDRNNQADNANAEALEELEDFAATSAAQPIIIRASYSGVVGKINVKNGQTLAPQTSLLTMSDNSDLRFVATLPLDTKPQLSIGQSVNFTADELTDTFSGQVSQLQDSSQNPDELLITVHVINNDLSRAKLQPNMMAAGRVDYGQIEVGTIVPLEGIHDVDLTTLQKPPFKPLSPLPANVWIIKQDLRLTRQPVEVIEFNPNTKQYLVTGISNDSLICLAKLPLESAGKKVVVS